MRWLTAEGAALACWWYPPSATVEFLATMTVTALTVAQAGWVIRSVAETVESWQNRRV